MNSRQRIIAEFIEEKREVTLASLRNLVPDVSEMTIRRDLEALEHTGHIVRVHGGARSVKAINMLVEDVFSKRLVKSVKEKREICKKAMQYIENNKSIYIDAGSTTMMLAENMPDKNLLISTCGLNVAAELLRLEKPRINLLGGEVNKISISTSGPSARASIENLNFDVAFIASTAFSEKQGFSCGNVHDCELKREVLRRAALRIVLMDSSKIGRTMPYTFARPNDIDILICDDDAPKGLREFFEDCGAQVL